MSPSKETLSCELSHHNKCLSVHEMGSNRLQVRAENCDNMCNKERFSRIRAVALNVGASLN